MPKETHVVPDEPYKHDLDDWCLCDPWIEDYESKLCVHNIIGIPKNLGLL